MNFIKSLGKAFQAKKQPPPQPERRLSWPEQTAASSDSSSDSAVANNSHWQSEPFDFDTTSLCETCSKLNWASILKATPSEESRDSFMLRNMYKLDGMDRTGAPFLRGSIPSIAEMAADPPSCPLCHLWLRAYRRAFPEIDPRQDGRRHKTSWFTYYINDDRYFGYWGGNPRSIDDDPQASDTRQRALTAFRMRFRGYEESKDFAQLLELTCLDEHLPAGFQSRGARLLPNEAVEAELLREWMNKCLAEHGTQCDGRIPNDVLQSTAGTFKLRLLDVRDMKVVVRSFNERYCAVSYEVWGTASTFRVTRRSFKPDPEHPEELIFDLTETVPSESSGADGLPSKAKSALDLLPRTIIDAIEVTKRLQIPYLWVDSICILQDETELRAAIENMHLVYKQAVLTIVGAAGADCGAGLPRSHPTAPSVTQITSDISGRTFMMAQPLLDLVLSEAAWSSRCWTFQEGKLPSRILVFTRFGVYWRCRRATWAEDSVEYAPKFPRHGTCYYRGVPDNAESAFADYTYDVRIYTKRSLGNQEDAISAFSGWISEMQRTSLPTPFSWGLPQKSFDAALLWRATNHWEYHDWAYRDPGSVQDVRKNTPAPERGQDWVQIHANAVRSASRGFSWQYEDGLSSVPDFARLRRRQGFPSWSWCGWEGAAGYFPRTETQPDLHLLRAIKGSVIWPWNAKKRAEFDGWESALEHNGILTFQAWHVHVDFDKLPYGYVAEEGRKAWVGWPLDAEPPLRTGVAECILLSRQLKHPVNHAGAWFEHYRTLDPVKQHGGRADVPLVNVMVIRRGADGVGERRGVGLMREDVWNGFKPKLEVIKLA